MMSTIHLPECCNLQNQQSTAQSNNQPVLEKGMNKWEWGWGMNNNKQLQNIKTKTKESSAKFKKDTKQNKKAWNVCKQWLCISRKEKQKQKSNSQQQIQKRKNKKATINSKTQIRCNQPPTVCIAPGRENKTKKETRNKKSKNKKLATINSKNRISLQWCALTSSTFCCNHQHHRRDNNQLLKVTINLCGKRKWKNESEDKGENKWTTTSNCASNERNKNKKATINSKIQKRQNQPPMVCKQQATIAYLPAEKTKQKSMRPEKEKNKK